MSSQLILAAGLGLGPLGRLFDSADFPPRWRCGQWTALHGWTHIVADLAIFGAYLTIPALLVYFVRRREDVPFPRVFWLFVAFIAACGITHLVEATLFWHPWYRLSALLKVVTAVVSWATVFALIPVLPRALGIPGLAAVNERLEKEIQRRGEMVNALSAKRAELEQVLHVLSHDLKTPLVTIGGNAGLARQLLRDGRPEEALAAFDHVERGVEQMNSLLEGLQRLSLLRHGRIEREQVPLEELLAEALQGLRAEVEAAGAEVVVEGPLPEVRVERANALQAIANLVGNALHHGRPGVGPHRVRVGAEEHPDEVRLFVQDAGPGIPEEDRERMFLPFERLETDKTGNEQVVGIGVGLAAVALVMERHGGRAWIDSPAEGGTIAWLAFPRHGGGTAAGGGAS